MIGAWCFLDRYGPLSFTDEKPMDVAPHPHIGLQTVSWLYEGEVLHRDSLGNENLIRPGELNIMTSGAAIAHSEETPVENRGRLNGAQLWVALPEARRNGNPEFQHVDDVPELALANGTMRLFVGRHGGTSSPAQVHTPLLGAELALRAGETMLELEPEHEHGILVEEGRVEAEGQPLLVSSLYYLPAGRSSLTLTSERAARALLLGGLPFPEPILMWWNFVARSWDEIEDARVQWNGGDRFGAVHGYRGARLEAPELKRPAGPQPMS